MNSAIKKLVLCVAAALTCGAATVSNAQTSSNTIRVYGAENYSMCASTGAITRIASGASGGNFYSPAPGAQIVASVRRQTGGSGTFDILFGASPDFTLPNPRQALVSRVLGNSIAHSEIPTSQLNAFDTLVPLGASPNSLFFGVGNGSTTKSYYFHERNGNQFSLIQQIPAGRNIDSPGVLGVMNEAGNVAIGIFKRDDLAASGNEIYEYSFDVFTKTGPAQAPWVRAQNLIIENAGGPIVRTPMYLRYVKNGTKVAVAFEEIQVNNQGTDNGRFSKIKYYQVTGTGQLVFEKQVNFTEPHFRVQHISSDGETISGSKTRDTDVLQLPPGEVIVYDNVYSGTPARKSLLVSTIRAELGTPADELLVTTVSALGQQNKFLVGLATYNEIFGNVGPSRYVVVARQGQSLVAQSNLEFQDLDIVDTCSSIGGASRVLDPLDRYLITCETSSGVQTNHIYDLGAL